MDAVYSYDQNLMAEIQANMSQAATTLQNKLTDLEQSINRSLADWNDEAKEIYFQHKAQWNSQAAQLPVKLGRVHQAIGNVLEVLTGATNQAVRTFS